jgi:hypothetical protein
MSRYKLVRFLVLTSILSAVLGLVPGILRRCEAQVTSGTILGRVIDPSGAAVANAHVSIINTGTNIRSELLTNSNGNFEQPYLLAGQYELVLEASGFRLFRQTNIILSTAQRYRIDVSLEIGQTSQSVVVAANAQVLQTDASDISETIDHHTIENLPNINRNPLFYASTIAGVVATGAFLNPNNVNTGEDSRKDFSSFVVNGSRPLSSDIQLDGAPNTNNTANEAAVLPNMDAIGEVRVITNAYSAEFGRAGGGVINFTTKSGTNEVHGSLYEDFRNSAMNANAFGNNTFGRNADGSPVRPKAPFNTNQFGGTFSGPVWMPKLYNGHNRTFFFVSYEGLRRAQGASTYYTVPTAAERVGDFSKTRTQVTGPNGTQAVPVNVYLPFPSTTTTTQVAAGQYQLNRQPAIYNGVANVIPPQFLNPVALKLASLYPLPNITPVNPDGTLNYFTNATTHARTDQLIVRLDHNFSDTQRGFFRWTTDWTLSNPPNIFSGTAAAANNNGPTTQFNPSATLGYDWTISPRAVLELRGNVTRTNLLLQPVGGPNSVDLTSLGIAANELVNLPSSSYPRILNNPYPQIGLGNFAFRNNHSTNYSFTPNFTKLLNKWTLKIGGEYLALYNNYLQPFVSSLAYSSTAAMFSAACEGAGCPALPYTTVQGWSAANFLMGAADGAIGNGEFSTGDPANAYKSTVWALYSQNDWKPTSRLTVNLGLRWEFQSPQTERYNRQAGFDLSATNVTGTAGAYQFTGVNGVGRGLNEPFYKGFAPRVGFAYRIGDKTVIRSAYGISYDVIVGTGSGGGADGFSSPSYIQIRPSSGLDILQAPFNDAFSKNTPPGGDPNDSRLLGNNVTAFVRKANKVPYMQQWNFTIERQLPASLDLQVAYVGTKGTYLSIQQHPVNQTDDIPQSTLNAALATYQQTGVNPLTSYVPNPFYPTISGNTNLNAPTVQRQYLALPYPAFGGVTVFQDRAGSSNYNSLQTTVRRAFAQGLQVLASYTWSKMIDYGGSYGAQIQTGGNTGTNFWAPDNMRLDRSVSAFDSTHRASISFVYELPFGRGRQFLNHVPAVSQIVGGWKVGGVATFASGFPIGISGGPGGGFNRPNVTENPVLPSKYQVTGDGHTSYPLPDGSSIVVPAGYKLYFNPNAFAVPVLTVPRAGSTGTVNVVDPYFYGTAPRLFSNLRGPGIDNWDMTVSRTFSVTEKLRLDARLEAYNAMNRVQIGMPGGGFLNPNLVSGSGLGLNTSTAFGTINTATIQTAIGQSSNTPRYLQISLRLYW